MAEAIATIDQEGDVTRRVFGLLLPMPGIFIVNVFDALGEKHGRETFAPLLSIEGARDMTQLTDLAGFAAMQAPAEAAKGTKHAWWNPLALGPLTTELLLKSFDWKRRAVADGADANIMYELWGVVWQSQQSCGRASLINNMSSAGHPAVLPHQPGQGRSSAVISACSAWVLRRMPLNRTSHEHSASYKKVPLSCWAKSLTKA